MRSFAHWTPQYIAARLREEHFRRTHPDAPWLTPSAISILDSWLRSSDEGAEWGSGRSTAWLGSRVRKLSSFEHDTEWYSRVSKHIPPSVNLRHFPNTPLLDPNSPYVRAAESFDAESLDFSIVDGVTELRDACTVAILPKLKRGGLLVVDNINWFIPHDTPSPMRAREPFSPLWAEIADFLSEWRCIWTSNGVTDTALWIKPA